MGELKNKNIATKLLQNLHYTANYNENYTQNSLY